MNGKHTTKEEDENKNETVYSWEQVQYYAWLAVQWSFKKENRNRMIRKKEIEDYLNSEQW